ncbi:MAG: cupin domain-containing protein [Methylococcales bacterium]|nr:cupin domain-containing protein [Methylococcales bacterium]
MKVHKINELQSLAALQALGILDDTEKQTFDSLLAEQEETRAALIKFERTAPMLAALAPEKQPPTALRECLLRQVSGSGLQQAKMNIAPGLLLVFAEHMDWQETGVPGVRVKTLYVDKRRNYASNLVSMTAGSIYPRHRHTDLEELFMLSGDIRLSGHRLKFGDYCRAEPGTIHDEVVAISDCMFIALASLHNEFRPAAH